MQRTSNPNINTRSYWNKRYSDREAYSKETGMVRFDKALEYIKPKDVVLDIGCGIGTFTHLVKKTYPQCEVWGTDISSTAIEDNARYHKNIFYFTQTVGQQELLDDEYFDVVFSGEVLEHLDDPTSLFKDAHRALKHKGIFILTTPYMDMIRSPEHTYQFSYSDIGDMYYDHGFNNVEFIKLPEPENSMIMMVEGRKI